MGAKPAIRILALGESTTADNANGFDIETWPRQLEKILKSKGLDVRVFNEGRSATTSAHIVSRLQDHIAQYQPHIVISMMGINDAHFLRLFPPQQDGLKGLRIYRLSRLLYQIASEQIHQGPRRASFDHLSSTPKFIEALRTVPVEAILPEIQNEARDFDNIKRAQYYDYLGSAAEPALAPASDAFKNSFKLYGLSLEEYFEIRGTAEKYVFMMSKVRDFSRCKEILKKYINEIGPLNETFLMKATACRAANPNDDELLALLSNNRENIEVKTGFNNPDTTRENYLALSKVLRSKNIRHIAMQYPLRDIAKVQEFFAFANEDERPHFVSNQSNFQNALMKYTDNDLFTDRFAGDFGHTTTLGHKLIAVAACDGVLQVLGVSGSCDVP